MAAPKPPTFSEATATAMTATVPAEVNLGTPLTGSTIKLPPGAKIYHRTFTPVGDDVALGAQTIELARRDVARRRKPVALDGLLSTVHVSKEATRLDAFVVTGQDIPGDTMVELCSLQYDGLDGVSDYIHATQPR
jgi:hypothetical protein